MPPDALIGPPLFEIERTRLASRWVCHAFGLVKHGCRPEASPRMRQNPTSWAGTFRLTFADVALKQHRGELDLALKRRVFADPTARIADRSQERSNDVAVLRPHEPATRIDALEHTVWACSRLNHCERF